MYKKILLTSFILFVSIDSVPAEIIRLQSGRVIEGKIVERTEDYVKIDTGIGMAVTYYLDEIKMDSVLFKEKYTEPKEEYPEDKKWIAEENFIAENSSPKKIRPSPQKIINNMPKKRKKAVLKSKKREDFLIEKIINKKNIVEDFGVTGHYLVTEHYLLTQIERQGKLQLQNIKTFILATAGKNNPGIQKNPFLALVPIGIILYNLICFPLMMIATKIKTKNSWMAWIPVLQIYLFVKMGEKPWWWVLFLFIPVFGFFIYLILWMNIVISLRLPAWQGLLMAIPIVNVYVSWKFAFE